MVTVYQVTQRGYAMIAFDPLPETAGPDGTKFDMRCVKLLPSAAPAPPTLSVDHVLSCAASWQLSCKR